MYCYECDSGDRRFATQRACDQHMDAVDHHSPTYECERCDRCFNTWHACKQHMTAVDHWLWKYECDTCSERSVSQSQANDHMGAKNHWSYPFDCETCNYSFRTADARDDHQEEEGHYSHLHCQDCNRYFQSEHHLRQHMNSRAHRPDDITCPFCGTAFTTATGVSHHLERSACPKARNLNSQTIHQAIRQRDTKGVITEHLLEWHENDRLAQWDPSAAWNGWSCHYHCYLCTKAFKTANGLRMHITSPAHQQQLYHCPNRNGSCRGKKFTTLAGLFNHLESESCGFVKFDAVKRNVNGFLTGGSQKLIAFWV